MGSMVQFDLYKTFSVLIIGNKINNSFSWFPEHTLSAGVRSTRQQFLLFFLFFFKFQHLRYWTEAEIMPNIEIKI